MTFGYADEVDALGAALVDRYGIAGHEHVRPDVLIEVCAVRCGAARRRRPSRGVVDGLDRRVSFHAQGQ